MGVPGESFPCNPEVGEANRISTFQQFFHEGPGVGSTELCPLAKPRYQALAMQTRSVEKQMHEQCGEGQAYCWMNCLDVPQEPCANATTICKNQYDKPCCTDTVTENCESMDQSCGWEQTCKKTGPIAILSGGLWYRHVHARIHDEWEAEGCLCYFAFQLLGVKQQGKIWYWLRWGHFSWYCN